MKLMVFNLSVAAFNDKGEQVPELQQNLAGTLAARLMAMNIDPTTVPIETGSGITLKLVKDELGWNYTQWKP